MAVKILVVEDNMIIAADISTTLSQRGYEVVGILSKGESVIEHLTHDLPDIILMDISLKGDMDGIEAAKWVYDHHDIPVIFLTANVDEATFERAKAARPKAFIAKPFDANDVDRAIDLAISNLEVKDDDSPRETGEDQQEEVQEETNKTFILKDRIFIRHKDRMIKIDMDDIQYVAAESNYSRLVTKDQKFLLAVTLKALGAKLDDQRFLRVHRSYIINIHQLEEVGELYLRVAQEQIPISKSHRESLFKRLKTI